MIAFRRILCPIDCSPSAVKALEYAMELGRQSGGCVKAMLTRAQASDMDLIVMGAQGTGGVELMMSGSNTQHVVRAASCPVLTVRA